ncbi:MAG: transporter [Alphaproteobacteria bacterium]
MSTAVVSSTAAFAEEAKPSAALLQLQVLIEQHRKQIEAQEVAIAEQRRRLLALENQVYAASQMPRAQPAVYQPLAGLSGGVPQNSGQYVAQDGAAETTQPSGSAQIAASDDKTRPPEVVVLSERGGVLTPKGSLIIEPTIDYSKSTSNRLNFRGISIVDGFLIGVIEASDADRDTITSQITGRFGVTNRLEIEVSVPHVYRSDRTTSLVGGSGGSTVTNSTTGDGLGDIEVAAHYQINDGTNDWPFFIANLRYKSTTGTGPFDISRDGSGIPTELATGSGFQGVEPSLTIIYPTDPAVLFANIGYLVNLPSNVNTTVGSALIGDVDPGDSIGMSFGVGFAMNEKLSLNLGYQHDFVLATTTETNGVDVKSETLSVGSFLFGGSYRLTDAVSLNLTVQIGATVDAPDSRIIFRVPVRFNVL